MTDHPSLYDSESTGTLYIFPKNAAYKDRLKPLATVTVVYAFEGKLADMKTYTGNITPGIFKEIVGRLEEKGVLRMEYRRYNTGSERARAYSIPGRRFVPPLFDLL